MRGLKLQFGWRPETEHADVSSTQRVVEALLLPALAGLTRLTSLEVASSEVEDVNGRSLNVPWPALAPLAALTALQQLRLELCCNFSDDVIKRLSQLPAGSLSALTQLRLYSAAAAAVGVLRPDLP